MKRILVFIGVITVAISLLVACGEVEETTKDAISSSQESKTETTSSQAPAQTTAPEALLPYDAYDLDSYMLPVWEGNTVYNESVMFVGKDDRAPLLYTPSEILSVRSSDLKTEYKRGVDYDLVDGELVLCEGSSIPVMAKEEYYPQNSTDYGCFNSNLGAERPFVRWGEGDTFTKFQVAVTYRHTDTYSGFVPKAQSECFPKTLAKLKNGEKVTIVFYGDSITEGYNTSDFIGVAPHAPRFSEMSAAYLGKLYQNENVTCINTAVAGKDSAWGLQNLPTRVLEHSPDLVVIAFGMNDGGLLPTALAQRLVNMAKSAKNKGAEVLLVATMLPNREAAGFWGNQHGFEEAILKAVKDSHHKFGVV